MQESSIPANNGTERTQNDDHSSFSDAFVTLIRAAIWTADRSNIRIFFGLLQRRVHVAFFRRSRLWIRPEDHITARNDFLTRGHNDRVTVVSPGDLIVSVALAVQISVATFARYRKRVVGRVHDLTVNVTFIKHTKTRALCCKTIFTKIK